MGDLTIQSLTHLGIPAAPLSLACLELKRLEHESPLWSENREPPRFCLPNVIKGNVKLLKLDLLVAFGNAENARPNVGLVPNQLEPHLIQEVLFELRTSGSLVPGASVLVI